MDVDSFSSVNNWLLAMLLPQWIPIAKKIVPDFKSALANTKCPIIIEIEEKNEKSSKNSETIVIDYNFQLPKN